MPKRLLARAPFVAAATIVIASLSLNATYAAPAVHYIRSYGSGNGMQSGRGQLSTPYGVAIQPKNGNVVVADSMNNRLEIYRDGGKFLKSFGKEGSKAGQFNGPDGLGLNAKGDLYVADEGNHRIQEFSPSLKFVRQFGAFSNGPSDLAVAPNGDVYAADGALILHFKRSGSYIGSFGGSGTGPGEFNSTVSGLSVGPKGNVWAGDYSGGRVEKFTASGSYLLSFGTSGKGAVQGPIGVAATKSAVFVSDNGHERVVEFNPFGKFVEAFGTSGKGKLDNTGPLALDCRGNLYDSDFDVGRIREYGNPSSPNGICKK